MVKGLGFIVRVKVYGLGFRDYFLWFRFKCLCFRF